MEKLNFETPLVVSGILVVSGTYYCIKGCRDIYTGDIKKGLREGAVGAVAVAMGVYSIVGIWNREATASYTIRYRKWSNGLN